MSTISNRLLESLHRHLKKISSEDSISINQFVASAVAEKIAAMEAENYIKERAKNASITKYKAILSRVPDVEPDEME